MNNFSKQKKYSGKLNIKSEENDKGKATTSHSVSKTSKKCHDDSVPLDNASPSSVADQNVLLTETAVTAKSLASSSASSSSSSSSSPPSPSPRSDVFPVIKAEQMAVVRQVPPSPKCTPSLTAERILRGIVESAAELSPLQSVRADDSFLHSARPLSPSEEEYQVWISGMKAFEVSMSFLLNYFRSFPDFDRLPGKLQWYCAKRSLSSLTLAQMTLHSRSTPDFTPFYSFSPKLRERWMAHFPGYSEVNLGVDFLASCFNSHSFTFAEFAFICALFAIRNDHDGESNLTPMVELRTVVLDALQIYLRNVYNGDSNAVALATARLFDIVRMMTAIQNEIFVAIGHVAATKAHLQMSNQAWAETYQETLVPIASPRHRRSHHHRTQVPHHQPQSQDAEDVSLLMTTSTSTADVSYYQQQP